MFLKENVSERNNLYIFFFLSLCNTLHPEETSSVCFFSKFGRNNLNSYNLKTHVIQTNFESPREFGVREFNCISMILANF